jgi:hypothetical protein
MSDFDNVSKTWTKMMRSVNIKRLIKKNCDEKRYREIIRLNETMDHI